MIYLFPSPDDPIYQGDIVDGCPILQISHFDLQSPDSPRVACSTHRVVVMTQTCDLASQKTQRVVVAIVHSAQFLVAQKIVKAGDVRGPIRAGRVFGWYFLPAATELELEESIVDLRQLFTVPVDVIRKSTDLLDIAEVPDSQVARAVRYIAEHYRQPIQTDDVVAQTGISKSHLQDRFVRHMGRTIHDQIIRKRIEHAKKLLRTTDHKTLSIARDTGFGSRERFSKTFKQVTGMSPVAYRNGQS